MRFNAPLSRDGLDPWNYNTNESCAGLAVDIHVTATSLFWDDHP